MNTAEPVGLSSTALPVWAVNGVSRVPGGDRPANPLGLVDLYLIEALAGWARRDQVVAEVAARSASDPAIVEAAFERLDEWGWVRHGHGAPAEPEPIVPTDDVGLPDGALVGAFPVVLRPTAAGFEHVDHHGRVLLRLRSRELAALAAGRAASTPDERHARQVELLGERALDRAEFDGLVRRCFAVGLLMPQAAASAVESRAVAEYRQAFAKQKRLNELQAARVRAHESSEAARAEATGRRRTRVVPLWTQSMIPPLALGMVVAHAKATHGGRVDDHFHFVPDWHVPEDRLREYAVDDNVYLVSNYIWSHEGNLALCDLVKQVNPRSITILGGPDTPRYEADVADYFRMHPSVDIAVHGEGEATLADVLWALRNVMDGDGQPDLSVLADVPGISYRGRDGGVVRTADRERLTELDPIPSPYLTGEFDIYGEGETSIVIIETNRGCPYSCTFCDWGSATASRIRKFDLQRVFDELEWAAKHRVTRVFVADANFGILERDVEIAEHVARLKATYGYPKVFATNYAKNTVKHLKRIVQLMVESGILTEGLLSLQSMDETTLSTIRRSNIKVEKYDELAREFRRGQLPLFVDLMLGLPGSTVEGFRNDLQQCIDREVTAKIFQTEVLVNSPMNEPSYREQHQIETMHVGGGWYRTGSDGTPKKGRALVVATSSFTRADYDEMLDLRRVFRLLENFGVLRHLSRFVRQETGVREVELFERVRQAVAHRPDAWPLLSFTVSSVPDVMVPPLSWSAFYDEVHRFVVKEIGMADDTALRTVIEVQKALLPARGREFPYRIDLDHDYAAWHAALIAAKDDGRRDDWTAVVPRLETYGPGRLEVEDPHEVCTRGLGFRNEEDFYGDWELASPVGRAMPARHLAGN